MTEITIDVVVQDQTGCLTVSGPLRLLERFVSTLGRETQTSHREAVEPQHLPATTMKATDAA